MTTIPKTLAQQVRARARHRCEYCLTSEWISGQRHEVDHIIPRARDGPPTANNLCLACAMCNGFKSDHTHALDPESNERVALFNPRTQHWHDHFAWNEDGSEIIGLTPCGRATVVALQMNQPFVVAARAVWAKAERHPPPTE